MDIWAIIGGVALLLGIIASAVQILEYLQKRRDRQAVPSQQPSPAPSSAVPVDEHKHLIQLRQILTERFDEGELRTLCFDLDVDYGSLPGEGKADKARELLLYLDRRDQIRELVEVGQQLRPDAPWAEAYLDDRMDQYRARRDQADKSRREMRQSQRVVNLRPLDATHTFKDRLREIRTLHEHLADESVRLVSIVGRGGMGKTALVSRVLTDLERGVLSIPDSEEELPLDGILYLSTRSTGLGLERIYADVGRMLGEPAASRLATHWASSDASLAIKVEYLVESMRDGLYLILLDNLEDELSEQGEIAEEGLRLFVERCLTQSGGARLIATSREQVKIADAALRKRRTISLREGLPEDEAIALLRELDPDGTLGLRDAREDELRHAVSLTQGIPRALEIVAGILREDPAASLARLLDDEESFGEQVVERLVAQGYQRLGENERRVMDALAVYNRPVEETAVAFLLHPWFPGMDVRSSLRRLVSGYFVSANRVTGEYELHPLDRDHAYRSLPDDDEPNAHSRHNLELRAADFYASIRKPNCEWHSIDDLAPQLAEFEHRIYARDYSNAFGTMSEIAYHLHLWGHYNRLVEMREKLLGKLSDSDSRASNLSGLGAAMHSLGQYDGAIRYHTDALSIARETGDRAREARQLGHLGRAHHLRGQAECAIDYYQRALSIFREIKDRRQEAKWLAYLAWAYRFTREVEKAIRCYETALEIAREEDDREGEGRYLGNLGRAYQLLGQIERAFDLCGQALSIVRHANDRRYEGFMLGILGTLYYDLGQVQRAIQWHQHSLDIACEIGNLHGQVLQLYRLGVAHGALGEIERATDFHQRAQIATRGTGDRRRESYNLVELGRAYLTVGNLSEAQEQSERALHLNMPDTSHRAAMTLGIVLLHQNDANAGEIFTNAVARSNEILNKTATLFEARYTLAAALVGETACDPRWMEVGTRPDLLAPALTEYRRALKNCDKPGVVGDAVRDLKLIRAAGIEGVEPVFELLESALPESVPE